MSGSRRHELRCSLSAEETPSRNGCAAHRREPDPPRGSGRTTSAAAVVLKGGVVALVFDGEKAFGFVAVTRCERSAVALGRGPSAVRAGRLGAADLLLSVVVTIMIIINACSTDD